MMKAPADLLPDQALHGQLQPSRDRVTTFIRAGASMERTGGRWIFALSDDSGSATRRRIRIGRRNAEQIEILEGLEADDAVVTSDYRALENSDSVQVEK